MTIRIVNGRRQANPPYTKKLFEGAYLAGPYHDPEGDEYSWTLWTWLEGRDLEKAQDAALEAVGDGADFIDDWEPVSKYDARQWLLDIRDDQEFPGEPARPDWARINIMKVRKGNGMRNSSITVYLADGSSRVIPDKDIGAPRADDELVAVRGFGHSVIVKRGQHWIGFATDDHAAVRDALAAARRRNPSQRNGGGGTPIDEAAQKILVAYRRGGRDAAGKAYEAEVEARKLKNWEAMALAEKFRKLIRDEPKKANPRSAPDKYGDRTGYHVTLSFGQLPTKAEFLRIYEDEMGSKSYPMTLRGEDAHVMQSIREREAGNWDADGLWELLKKLVKKFERGSDDAGSLASSILETLGIEWV